MASHPPFRADHIGSLLRPAGLRAAHRDLRDGKITVSEHARLEDDAIRQIVRLQEETGFSFVNDGEFRRGSYWGRFVERTQGLATRAALYRFHDDEGHETEFTAPYVVGKLARGKPIAVDEVRFVRSLTQRAVKVTLPAPSTLHFWRGQAYAEPGLYPDSRAFFADLAQVFQAELRELAREGANYVQFDEVALAMLCDPSVRERLSVQGENPDALADLYIQAINGALAGRPEGIAIGLHLCRGNYKGRYLAAGGYESIAEKLFQEAQVDHFLLEYDTPRAGDFAPLRWVPGRKGVVLGLVSSKTSQLETSEALERRIDEATRFIDLDRLGLSPQCGFASTAAGNPLTEEHMAAKLRLVAETARSVWGVA